MNDDDVISIASDESDNEQFVDRRAILQPAVQSVVDAVGGVESGAYRLGAVSRTSRSSGATQRTSTPSPASSGRPASYQTTSSPSPSRPPARVSSRTGAPSHAQTSWLQ
ncbi:hypothetical protein B0H21DRAFT_736854 [Amylocystis lapponica]|nr:hypothetical protein B0H21DRAFT_736854 [Amylocystis lapponica]